MELQGHLWAFVGRAPEPLKDRGDGGESFSFHKKEKRRQGVTPAAAKYSERLRLLQGGAIHDLDALHALTLVRTILGANLSGSQLLQHVVALDELAEGRVLTIQEARVAVADEELAACRIRILGPGHGDHTPLVGALVELGLDLVARVAGAPAVLLGIVLGQRIAALDHETLDDPMERGAIVEALLGQGFEILDGLRGHIRPELDDHVAGNGLDDGDLVGGVAHWGFFFVSFGGSLVFGRHGEAAKKRGGQREKDSFHASHNEQQDRLSVTPRNATPWPRAWNLSGRHQERGSQRHDAGSSQPASKLGLTKKGPSQEYAQHRGQLEE